jgi:hypothetical protein
MPWRHEQVLEPYGGLQGHPRVPRERDCEHDTGPLTDVNVPSLARQQDPGLLRDVHVPHRVPQQGPGPLCDVNIPHGYPSFSLDP